MGDAKNIDELKRAFATFLEATKFSLHQLVVDYKGKLEGFDKWWGEKGKFLNEDELTNFFAKRLRNDVIKGGEELLAINFKIGEATLNGPLQIGPEGVLKLQIKNRVKEWVPMDVPTFEITTWDIRNKPESFNNTDGYSMCKKYFNILNNIADEFIEKFCI